MLLPVVHRGCAVHTRTGGDAATAYDDDDDDDDDDGTTAVRYVPVVVVVPEEVLGRQSAAAAVSDIASMLAENPKAAAMFQANGWTAQSFALGMLLDAAIES